MQRCASAKMLSCIPPASQFQTTLHLFLHGILKFRVFESPDGLMLSTTSFSVIRLYQLSLLRAELGEEMRRLPNGQFFEGSGMLANKPRSTANLTKWMQHHPAESEFFCTCRGPQLFLYSWRDAQWIPNLDTEMDAEFSKEVDPGGGRFVILCSCSLGHYKLKA